MMDFFNQYIYMTSGISKSYIIIGKKRKFVIIRYCGLSVDG